MILLRGLVSKNTNGHNNLHRILTYIHSAARSSCRSSSSSSSILSRLEGAGRRETSFGASMFIMTQRYPQLSPTEALKTTVRSFSSSIGAISSDHEGNACSKNDKEHSKIEKVKILYASQTGTAQMFAMQLADALELDEFTPLSEASTVLDQWSDDTLYIFIVSTAGVGEPPENGRAFYEALLQKRQKEAENNSKISYSIFALGNSAAHANHFCAFGQDLHASLKAVGAQPAMPLFRGDDAGCIEDDFDKYQQTVVDMWVKLQKKDEQRDSRETEKDAVKPIVLPESGAESHPDANAVDSKDAVLPSLFPALELIPPIPATRQQIQPATDLLDHSSVDNFYAAGTSRFPVKSNLVLRSDAASNATNPSALREMQLSNNRNYETGDHLMVYPRNSDVLVDAYMQVIQGAPDPHSIITGIQPTGSSNKKKTPTYPHPMGISIYETLRHCVDLQAVPSPALARYITGKPTPGELNYKTDIAHPRRTVLDLLLHSTDNRKTIPLADLLFQVPPMQPRYYSIASSHIANPDTIYLTYRPVKYYTSSGVLREGVCTSHLSSVLVPPPRITCQNNNNSGATTALSVVATICSNPQFRLPTTVQGEKPPPLILVAGGCGVAPIRAFLEELIWEAQHNENCQIKYGPVHLYLGFRHPDDEVYRDLVETACGLGLVAKPPNISYTMGGNSEGQCGLVSDSMKRRGQELCQLLRQERAVLYVCGGARLFGAAIQNALLQVLQQNSDKNFTMDETMATDYLRAMHREGRYHEDLSD